jgi:branched-chain amino acid transport system ATP-binding protein
MESQEVLKVENIDKSFGGLKALVDLEFSVNRGSIFGIIGPNGAGKTTLFNIITGFMRPDSGRVLYLGTDITNERPFKIYELGISRTFQLIKPFYGMTIYESLLIPSFAHGRDPRTLKEDKLFEILESLGLARKADEEVENLNQGELRLLDIARALVGEPNLLLLDEPFSGLASTETQKVSHLLLNRAQGGSTIVIIEHRLRELMQLVEIVLVLNFGEKIAQDLPSTVVKDERVLESYLGKKGVGVGIS